MSVRKEIQVSSPAIRFGCQTYTWQMSFDKYKDKIEHIISIVSAAGMSGLEPELGMLGAFASQPERLRDCLNQAGVTLGALCLVCDWRGARETPEEIALADATIAMLAEFFPGTLLALCQMPGADRKNLAERQHHAVTCINAVATRAQAVGIRSAFHPNSPEGSIFRKEDDYEVLIDGLDPKVVGFAPDAGHIAKGGMDPVQVFRDYASIIRHVHFKDMDASGDWIEMGRGCIDFRGIHAVLKKSGYDGWIMIEDESKLAEHDPDAATLWNGKFVTENLDNIPPEK
jgi:inosose dehydratase